MSKSTTKQYSFEDHPEHEAQLGPWRDKWIAIALSTEPADREKMVVAINGLYDAADLPLPKSILFLRSPLAIVLAGGIAAGILWLRDNPDSQQEMFDTQFTDGELLSAVRPAMEFSLLKGIKETNQSLSDFETIMHEAALVVAEIVMAEDNFNGATSKPLTKKQLGQVTEYLYGCVTFWQRMYDGGSDWPGYPAYLSFFDRVANLDLPIYAKWRHYEAAAMYGGPRIMHAKFAIVSDRQSSIKIDNNNRLHCEDGPAKRYADGWNLNYWHGTPVPWDFFEWDLERVLRESNAEVRRCGIERIGWDKLIGVLDLIGQAPDPGNGDNLLSLYDGKIMRELYDEPARLLIAVNGSPDKGGHRRVFGLPVPASVSDPLEAAALLYDEPVEVYKRIARRT